MLVKVFMFFAAVFGFLGVALGAIGGHFIKTQLSPDMFQIYEVGIRYMFYHVFALMGVTWAATLWHSNLMPLAGFFFIVGIWLFSGSLLAYVFTGNTWLMTITPFGGVALLLGWLSLALGLFRDE
jgi:uncharacterized membrane protein YgdD (TMEM256/DUF423 family)